jgi:hypothetical protein
MLVFAKKYTIVSTKSDPRLHLGRQASKAYINKSKPWSLIISIRFFRERKLLSWTRLGAVHLQFAYMCQYAQIAENFREAVTFQSPEKLGAGLPDFYWLNQWQWENCTKIAIKVPNDHEIHQNFLSQGLQKIYRLTFLVWKYKPTGNPVSELLSAEISTYVWIRFNVPTVNFNGLW